LSYGDESRVAFGRFRATTIPGTFRFSANQAECIGMEQQSLRTGRKTYQYKLMPTPEQERALETVLLRCRTLYNCAVEQRRTWSNGPSPSIGAGGRCDQALETDWRRRGNA
jgi:hypothetical protein